MTISLTERRYAITQPSEHYHITMTIGLLLNFDASSGYLPINLYNALISFLAEKP